MGPIFCTYAEFSSLIFVLILVGPLCFLLQTILPKVQQHHTAFEFANVKCTSAHVIALSMYKMHK